MTRTLLIDNYDSYTYNLYQLLARINGVEPVVLANDAPEARGLDLAAFDNIVISPGPGHPARARDFGVARRIVAEAPVPVLGVCLGHQGIAALAGARVGPAPRARHGWLTRVRHDGQDLFRGLPQDFAAVRYHSLCVAEPLPPDLVGTAWAEDGVNMGLRHRHRPLWGLQFHPESVATEYGAELIRNFRELTREHGHGRPRRPRAYGTARTAPAAPANGRVSHPPGYRLHVRTAGTAVDTEAAFGHLFAAEPTAFWLDSALAEPGRARFSYLGSASGPLAETVTYRVGSGRVEVRGADGTARSHPGTVFDYLRAELGRRDIDAPPLPFDFTGGYVGYFGYELKADCGSPNRHRAPTPDAQWQFPDRMLVVDHESDVTYLLALGDGGPAAETAAAGWLDDAEALLPTLPGRRAPAAVARAGEDDRAERWLVRDRDRYLADIHACRRALLAGESYEVCLTNATRAPATEDGFAFYRRLRAGNPAPYAAYLKAAGTEVACSSPERFLKVDRDRVVETRPIKGTAPRSPDPEEDRRLRDQLASSGKTRAENLMIVDLLRNDLGRVCEVGSVHVPRLMATETYASVHQLVSTVRGRLRPDLDVIDCLRACFPGGSMTGAPKLRTMEIIDALETEARGVYSGALGFLSCNGTADLNIVIRTAVRIGDRWRIGAGGAIVLDSDPVEEYEEMLLKARAVLRGLDPDGVAGRDGTAAVLADLRF
ncbi:aminodeoxychorismate synthase component I [Jidongwangia harbinensis]|uniref:aminodeoxychorismate synthase component I n=1 Tax=Jidongwangia harbinensis TaxID=2878561 RepID=UPI001CD94E8E|nr:aminodeoxychorismate synthase component I [Jidongwangia harbinensis]MCA2211627.1 aminodeoxychorismate synthase component I [Jidongwangia harbinensis]